MRLRLRKSRSLGGIRVAVLAADGFEPEELQRPVKRLRSEGALVSLVSPQAGRIRGMHLLERGKPHRVDHTLDSARARDFDALLLPGGHLNPDLLRQNERALSFVSEFDRSGKPIAALSRAPCVLISAGL